MLVLALLAWSADWFTAYPTARLVLDARVAALCAGVPLVALAPFIDRRGIDP
jgi:hypothetical protein